MEEMEQTKPTLFYIPKGSAQWQPIGKATKSHLFDIDTIKGDCEEMPTEQTHWADKGTFTATVTIDKVNPKLLCLLRGTKQRLPRKLKKAVKKLCIYDRGGCYYIYRKDGGHFNTKWLRKGAYHMALKMLKAKNEE